MAKIQERLIEALRLRGFFVDVMSRSSRYTVMRGPTGEKLYLGTSGALRRGESIAKSIPVSKTYRDILLEKK